MNNSTINFLPNDAVKIQDNVNNVNNVDNSYNWYKFNKKLINVGWRPKTPEDYHIIKNIYLETFKNDERKLYFNKPITFLENYIK